MAQLFISYARQSATMAEAVAAALVERGYSVWRDDQLPAHRSYADVIEEHLRSASAVVVLWSAEAVKSQWVRAEATLALDADKLVQLSLDGSLPPMPFNQIQCADLAGWSGNTQTPGWQKVLASVAELVSRAAAGPTASPQPQAHAAALSAVPALPGKPSIAVMPFDNLSGDPDQAYFADGMVLEIIDALSRFRSLFVIASGSSQSFKGRYTGAQDVARQLGVRYVLEGSVRKAGGRIRIGVQLIDATDNASIWTQRFEDTLEDVFELQDKVALAVAGRIEPTVRSAEFNRVAGRSTDNMGSYDLYLRGHAVSISHSREATFAALELLTRSITLDPQFGPALVRAAHCHRLIYTFGWSETPEDNRRQCLDLARRALQAASDDATVLATVAYIRLIVEGDDQAAIALVDRAVQLNPGSSRVLYWSGRLRLVAGDADRAISHIEASLRLDPVGPMRDVQIFGIGLGRFAQGRFEEAREHFRTCGLLGASSFANAFGAACFGHLGEIEEAQRLLALFHARSRQPLEAIARTWLHAPEHLELFLEGIARAKVTVPADAVP